jgi:23S rRNA (pseudouridine1915-N3)-methyltransferase
VLLRIVAVGQRVPDWAQTAWDDYAKRFCYQSANELGITIPGPD